MSDSELPSDLAAAHALILTERAARLEAEARARLLDLEIERIKLQLLRWNRERFGRSAERSAAIAQLEFTLEDLEEGAAAADVAAELKGRTTEVRGFTRKKPARRPLPEHLPRLRAVEPAPAACPCCGGALRKLGEDITETLERVPARWLVIQHVREKFSCRSCETITQPPAPFHPIARGRAGPNLLAEVVFAKYGMHLPLTRQSASFAREGIEIDVSTLSDWVGAVSATLEPLVHLIKDYARAGPRIHADDTPVPVLAKGRTKTGRLWTVVRDDRPYGGADPPAGAYFYSPDRSGEHPRMFLKNFAGIMQADAFSGFGQLYAPGREAGTILEAACWAHGRRKFFELADLKKAPIAIEAVRRIDALFEIEREINGATAAARLAARQARSRPLVAELKTWLQAQRTTVSAKSEIGKAIDYMLKRWPASARFLDDGRICLSNNAAERALRGIAVGRRNWTFAGSDEGGHRAADMYTLIETAKLNGVDPRAWLADVLKRLPGHPAKRTHELLPWNWVPQAPASAAA